MPNPPANVTINQAIGVLMVFHDCDADAAFPRLVEIAEKAGETMAKAAARVVACGAAGTWPVG